MNIWKRVLNLYTDSSREYLLTTFSNLKKKVIIVWCIAIIICKKRFRLEASFEIFKSTNERNDYAI